MFATSHDGINGFGLAPEAEVLELQKALTAGYATDPSSMAGGGALRVESLEPALKALSWQDKQIVLWRDVPKTKAFSTVEEWAELSAYGADGAGIWNQEGGLPTTQDSTYQRRSGFVKFAGTTREVTHPMTLVRSLVPDVVARENANGILFLLRNLEAALFFGDSKLGVGATEWVEPDGLDTLADNANVVDMRGNPLDERSIRDGAQTILDNYGVPTHIYGSPKVLEDYCKTYIPSNRILIPQASGTITAGALVDSVNTVAGKIMLRGDIFLRKFGAPPGTANAGAPTAPASVAAAAMAATGDGEWAKQTAGGLVVTYQVTACNAAGESTAVASGTTTVTAADLTKSITITITNANPMATAPVYYKVYRKDGSGTYSLIKRTPCTAGQNIAGGTTTWKDVDSVMPNTYKVFMLEMTPDVLEFRQLVDLVKMDLAVVAPAYRWMLLLYGLLTVYARKKIVVYKNIADAT